MFSRVSLETLYESSFVLIAFFPPLLLFLQRKPNHCDTSVRSRALHLLLSSRGSVETYGESLCPSSLSLFLPFALFFFFFFFAPLVA